MAPSTFLNLPLNLPFNPSLKPLRGLLLFLLLLLTACGPTDSAVSSLPTDALEINGRALTVELALNPDDQKQGLSDRESLADDRGMLFVFPDEKLRAFWMVRCHFDIDIAYIDASGKIVATHQMLAEPLDRPDKELKTYPSGKPAMMALELNAGGLERYGLAPGDQLDLPVLELLRRVR